MPELPDVTLYKEALERFVVERELVDVRLRSVFLLRSVVPPLGHAKKRRVAGVSRPCAKCQTDGRILRDRALSQLLKDDWPARLEDLEEE